jgi:hypothetical protein
LSSSRPGREAELATTEASKLQSTKKEPAQVKRFIATVSIIGSVALSGAMPTKAQTTETFTGNDMMPGCEAANDFVATGRVPNLSGDMALKAGYCLGQTTAVLYFFQLGCRTHTLPTC